MRINNSNLRITFRIGTAGTCWLDDCIIWGMEEHLQQFLNTSCKPCVGVYVNEDAVTLCAYLVRVMCAEVTNDSAHPFL